MGDNIVTKSVTKLHNRWLQHPNQQRTVCLAIEMEIFRLHVNSGQCSVGLRVMCIIVCSCACTIHSLHELAREQESEQNSSAFIPVWRVVIEKGV